jgi:hypothetical protein
MAPRSESAASTTPAAKQSSKRRTEVMPES